MDQISLDRIAEHEPHGWQILTELQAVHDMQPVPGYWMACSCGWRGWISRDPERLPVETFEQPM